MKIKILYILILPFILIFISCATVRVSPWQISSSGYSAYIPQRVYDFEEALANLQNLQSDLWINGYKPTDIYVDKFSFKAKLKWTNIEQMTDYVPTYGGFFIGWNYISTDSTTEQTSYLTIQKEDTVVLPFKDVTNMMLSSNDLCLNLNTGKTLYFHLSNENFVQRMADSVYSMLLFHNIKLPPIIGFSYDQISEEKLSYLNIINIKSYKNYTDIKSNSVYVKSVLSNSPAKLAGLCENDIILEINGEKISDIHQFSNVIDKALNDYLKDNNKIIKIKVFHFEENSDRTINWEERLIKIKPAIIQ